MASDAGEVAAPPERPDVAPHAPEGPAAGDDLDYRATHRDLSEHDLRFRELAARDPDLLARSQFALFDEYKDLLEDKIQPWPTFVGRRKMAELERVSLGVCRLIKSIPERVFRRDFGRLNDFYRLGSPILAELLLSQPNGIDPAVSRGDMIDTAGGFRCIEFNFSASLGGWETLIVAEIHRQVPVIHSYIARHGLHCTFTSTLQLFFLHLIHELRGRGLGDGHELNLLMVLDAVAGRGQNSRLESYLSRVLARACAEAGLEVQSRLLFAGYDEVECRQNQVFHAGLRIHALVEVVMDGTITPAPVFRAFKAGKAALFNGPVEAVLSSKKNLALLSEHVDSDAFSAEERELIRRHVPWTRVVGHAEVILEGERLALPALLASQRERLVLKEADSSGGKAVVLGRYATPARWSEAVRGALDSGNWVVQEFQQSLPYLYQCNENSCAVHDVIWGPFVFGSTFGGVLLRMQPRSEQRPVNSHLNAAEGVVFETDSD